MQHLAVPLMERINGALGRTAVQRLRFVQEGRDRGRARGPAPRRPAPPRRRGPECRTGPCATRSQHSAARSWPIALDGTGTSGGINGPVRHRSRIRMPLHRRTTLLSIAALTLPIGARAQPTPPELSERALGSKDAKVTVNEWFSLTCTHCAEFQKTTFPTVKKELIETGRVRYVWHDFPLDQVALMAAMVARHLPPERYEPFISTLLATQDRWAFTRGVNSTEELAKYAALAGMPRQAFDAAINDTALKTAILATQDDADKTLHVNSTPSFIINGKLLAGAVAYPAFLQAVDAAQS